MSFSSDASSASASSSTDSISTAPTSRPRSPPESPPPEYQKSHQLQQPNYKILESLLLCSVDLARASFTAHTRFGVNTPTAQYLSLHARVNKFLQKYREYDFVRDGTYGYVLEIGILLRLVESALGLAHRGLVGLECEKQDENDERCTLEKKCNRDVEYLVFGRTELDVGRLPWNMKSEREDGDERE